VLAAADIMLSHLELPQQPAEAASKAPPSAAAAADGSDSGAADLSAAPQWEWSAAESLLLPLKQYEVVEQLLRSCRPPLLGRGGTIPLATLAAFRCDRLQGWDLLAASFFCTLAESAAVVGTGERLDMGHGGCRQQTV
jgi:hypothetical protein